MMHASGLLAFEARESGSPESTQREQVLPQAYLAHLQSSAAAWQYFNSQPPWYQRTCATWVMDAKREETRVRRLDTLIADSEAGRWIKPLERANRR
jgi:uncharacterized protein YdeI (YjbR/CyaY-like superfamily)